VFIKYINAHEIQHENQYIYINQNYIRKTLTKENQNIIFLVCIPILLNGGFSTVGIPSMPCEAFNVWFGVLGQNQWEVLVRFVTGQAVLIVFPENNHFSMLSLVSFFCFMFISSWRAQITGFIPISYKSYYRSEFK
jgi:hypothetical protein